MSKLSIGMFASGGGGSFTGGGISSPIILDNNVFIQAKKTGGTVFNLIGIDSGNVFRIGDSGDALQTEIRGTNTKIMWAGTTYYLAGNTVSGDLNIVINNVERWAIRNNGNNEIATGTVNLSLFSSSPSYGSGSEVAFIKNATTPPSTNPSGGGIFYESSGALHHRGSGGAISQIAAAGEGTINSQNGLYFERMGFVQTTNATPATIITYSPPVNSGGVYNAMIVGRNTSTDAVAIYSIVGGHSRAGGAPTVYVQADATLGRPIQEPAAGYDAQFVVSGNNVLLQVTGAGATTIDWQAVWNILEN